MAIETAQITETISTLAQPEAPIQSTPAPSEETQSHVVKYIQACLQESSLARQEVQSAWDEGWSLYNNSWDFSAKEAWQSQMKDPLFGNLIDDASEGLKRATVSSLRYFRVVASNPLDKVDVMVAAFLTDLLQDLLRRAGIFRIVGGAYKNAWITNTGIVRVTSDTSTRTVPSFLDKGLGGTEVITSMVPNNGLKLKDIDPYFYFPDPTARGLYEVHEFTIDKFSLMEMASASKGFFNVDKIKDLEGTESPSYLSSIKNNRILQAIPQHAYRKPLRVQEFWGTLLDEDGTVMLKNALAYTVENQVLIFLDTNPLLDGKSPFVKFNLIHQTDAVWGRSYSHMGASLARERGYQSNLTADSMRYATLKAFGVDLSLLEDLDIVTKGIWPGAIIPTRGGEQSIKELNFNGPGGEVITFLMMLQDWVGNSMHANEFVTGRPSSRGRQTKGEVSIKAEQNSELSESMGMDLEQIFLLPLLEKSFYRVVEDFDFRAEPGLLGKLAKYGLNPEMFTRMTVAQRNELLGSRYRFEVTGLAAQISRMFIVENIMNFFKVVGNMGELGLKFAPKIEGMMNRMIDLLGLEPETMYPSKEMLDVAAQPLPSQIKAASTQLAPTAGGSPSSQQSGGMI